MTEHYKTKLIEMFDKLSEKALKRFISACGIPLYSQRERGKRGIGLWQT